MISDALAAVVCLVQMSVAAEPMLPSTTPPIVYAFGYTDKYFTDPNYLRRFVNDPPDLLQVGKAAPITHLWGPVPLYAGENQYTGDPDNTLNAANIALLTPEELATRIANIRDALARYHAIGIREIMPYIAWHTLAGDHQRRSGFWEFYDQWSRYEKWAGPRPERDPSEWLAVDRKGNPLEGVCGGYSPFYFAPLHRYRTCIHHPDWIEWQNRVVRLIAEVGYDGCFIDNANVSPCYCDYCKAGFRDWLMANRNLDWVCRLTRQLDREKLALDREQTPAELVRRWRTIGMAERLGAIREVGRKVKPGFMVFPNVGHDFEGCLTVGSQCDRLMMEGPPAPGLLCDDVPPGNENGAGYACRDHVAELLFTQHMRARLMWLLYYRLLDHGKGFTPDSHYYDDAAVYYLDYPLEERWDNVQELALAEMAAFGGGGGVAAGGRPQAMYRTFFKKHAELFDGWQPTAPAAVLFAHWGPNALGRNRAKRAGTIHDYLLAAHRPYVALMDASLTDRAEELAGFAAIYLESPQYEMSSSQLDALREYARQGCLVLADRNVTINGSPAVEALGDGRAAFWDRKQPTTRGEAIAPSQGNQKNVRFAIYRKADRLAIHAVNYNVCLFGREKKVIDVGPTPLRIPSPAGWNGAVATCFEPGAEPTTLPCTVADGCIRLTLPKLHIYKIILLERR